MPEARCPRSYWDFAPALKSLSLDPPETVNTSAVPVIAAMAASLRMLLREGYAAVYARNAAVAERARQGLGAMELRYVADGVPPARRSPTVTTVRCPLGIASQDVLAAARARGVMFQRGLGRLAETTFRIGHMGTVGDAELARGFDALEGALASLGARVPHGAWRSVLRAEDEVVEIDP
jgi:alanine-glyoxylate transaminase/serine-glyoxylate transaminase/serine-pyruvate transaminase